MTSEKRYYWLKLKEDFFRQKEIKKLRRIAGGDVYTIIYLKMLLRSMRDGGKLYYEGIEDNFPNELALDIDEDEENVKMTIAFLMANGILVQSHPDEYELLTVGEMTGSECDSAHRVRKLRAQKSTGDGLKALQSNDGVTGSNGAVTTGNVEIEIEIEKRDREKNNKRFAPPSVDDVRDYAREKGFTDQQIDPEAFVDFYESKGWRVGDNPMKDWKAACRNWARRYREKHPAQAPRCYDAPDDESIFW